MFLYLFDYNYDTLLNFTQSFIDTIRNSEKYNKERLLIISGMDSNMELTFSSRFKIPTDPANKFAISINYYIPIQFATNKYFWFEENHWGTKDDYKELLQNFITFHNFYVNKGIPVIIGEVGVITEESREISSIREYLYSIFSLSIEYEGIMACLWDTSNKNYGDMNYYNRLTDEWYDDKLKNIFMKISKGKIVKSADFYIYSNLETISNIEPYEDVSIDFGDKKPLKIMLNMYYSGIIFDDYYFTIYCDDSSGWGHYIYFDERNGKKFYDGTITYTIDLSNEDCHNNFNIYYYYGEMYFKNIKIEYQKNFTSFYYDDYKAKIISEIT
jgi:hypothetical protein